MAAERYMTDDERTAVESTIDEFIGEIDRVYSTYRRRLIKLGVNAKDASEMLNREMTD